MVVAGDAGAARGLVDTRADADVVWLDALGGAPVSLPPTPGADTVVVDLEDGGHDLGPDVVRPWIDAVAPGGDLVVAVGAGQTWRPVVEALDSTGRPWRLGAVVRHGPILHATLSLDVDSPGTAPEAFRSMAAAAAELGGAILALEQRAEEASAGSSVTVELVTPVADHQRVLAALDQALADLRRTRAELRRAEAALDRFRRSLPGRVFHRYRSVRTRLQTRRT